VRVDSATVKPVDVEWPDLVHPSPAATSIAPAAVYPSPSASPSPHRSLHPDLTAEPTAPFPPRAICTEPPPGEPPFNEHEQLPPDRPCYRSLGFVDPTSGRLAAVQNERLASMLGQISHLELVFLNACTTEELGRAINAAPPALPGASVPTVVCWATKVEDSAAHLFACAFFEGVGKHGMAWRQAFEHAKHSVGMLTEPAYTVSPPSGLQWLQRSGIRPREGTELTHSALCAALHAQKLEFSEEEWMVFGIPSLRPDHFVKGCSASGGGPCYFSPAHGRPTGIDVPRFELRDPAEDQMLLGRADYKYRSKSGCLLPRAAGVPLLLEPS